MKKNFLLRENWIKALFLCAHCKNPLCLEKFKTLIDRIARSERGRVALLYANCSKCGFASVTRSLVTKERLENFGIVMDLTEDEVLKYANRERKRVLADDVIAIHQKLNDTDEDFFGMVMLTKNDAKQIKRDVKAFMDVCVGQERDVSCKDTKN